MSNHLAGWRIWAAVPLVLAALAWAAPSWQGGVDIGGTMGNPVPGSARVAQNASGAAVAAWIETIAGLDRVLAARWNGQAWTVDNAIDGGPGANASSPDVAIGPDGRAVVAFEVAASPRRVQVARFDGGAWLVPIGVDSGSVLEQQNPSVGCGPSGKAVVTWDEGGFLFLARTFDGTAWGSAQELAVSGSFPGAVAMDASGTAIAVWSGDDGTRNRIFAALWNGTWSAPVGIDSDPVFESFTPDVAMDGSGNAVAAWVHNPGGAWRAKAASFDSTNGWATARYVDADPPAGGFDATEPRVAVSPGNHALVTFLKAGTPTRAWAASFDGTTWTAAAAVDAGTSSATAPSAALDASANGFVAYSDASGAQAARFSQGSFAPAESVAGGVVGTTSAPWVSAGPTGSGLAVFARNGNGHVSASSFASSGPAPDAPEIRRVTVASVAPGNKVTIKGRNFGTVQGTVTVDGEQATLLAWKTKSISLLLPEGAGPADVVIRTAEGSLVVAPIEFDGPVLSSVKAGKAKSGFVVVTLKGSGFGSVAHGEESIATLDGTEYGAAGATLLKWTDGVIKLRVPAPTGRVEFQVHTSAGDSAVVARDF